MNDDGLDEYSAVCKIAVIGVGGAGNNAVNRMIDENISNVSFYVCNTDKLALSLSKAPNRMVLGEKLTQGLGAGGDPKVGEEAAEASIDDIKNIVDGCNMVFIAAGMGGGTGTGAAPVIARAAKEAGALTISIVTRPFTFEGTKKTAISIEGLNKLKQNCDAMIVVSNDKLLMNSGNLPVGQAFSESDKVLAKSVQTVVDLVLMPAIINGDFNDVKAVLQDSGISFIGFGAGEGDNRCIDAARTALNCPLIEQSMDGARKAICHITCGPGVSMFECIETVNKIVEFSGSNIDIKFGIAINDQLGDQIMLSIIAGHFDSEFDFSTTKGVDLTSLMKAQKAKQEDEQIQKEINRSIEDTTKTDSNEESVLDDIIPNFLNGK